jgi:hypothetical protein
MPKEALDCINSQRTGVIAVKMPDGSPHGATVHFAHIPDPLMFIFLTSPSYKKLEPLRIADTPATFVVGTTEELNETLQMDGVAKLKDWVDSNSLQSTGNGVPFLHEQVRASNRPT